jgi:diadenosine tetraphosphatase ApaH/serine/threonine PP2A family protein phosphatase
MKYAILSDIHSNLEALESVLRDVPEGAKLVSLGDMVGYGASPNEVVALVRRRFDVVVMGNHDEAAVIPAKGHLFNHDAETAVNWTRKRLTNRNLRWLSELEYDLMEPVHGLLFVHGTPDHPEAFNYCDDIDVDWEIEKLKNDEINIAFVGHTHVPKMFHANGCITDHVSNEHDLLFVGKRSFPIIVNVGSVGQPRDGQEKATYAIYDSDRGTIEWRRVEYDIDTAANKIHEAGLPGWLADRLYAEQMTFPQG